MSPTPPALGRFMLTTALPAVAIELALMPLWFLHQDWLPLPQLVLTVFVLPIWLCVRGILFVRKSQPTVWPWVAFVLLATPLVCVAISYLSWALSEGSLRQPDAETVILEKAMATVACAISVIPAVLVMLFRLLKPRT